jgi:pilus retraction protein PilT
LGEERLSPADTEEFIRTLLTPEQFNQLQSKGELDLSVSVYGQYRYRVNAYTQRGSYAAAMRLVESKILSFAQLGLPAITEELCWKNRGLILVTGPTGHGKSTTLAAMIDLINTQRDCHIITLEDPIEYLHRHKKSIVNQREIGNDTQSFSDALRAALRQDPDIILVGECATWRRSPSRSRPPRPPPGALDAAYDRRGQDHRPYHRRLPAPSAAADQDPALDDAAGRHLPAAYSPEGREGPGVRR